MTPDDLMFKPGLMAGERVLITGGGTGLGKVMAEACLMLGATVYICGRRGQILEETAKELMEAHDGRCVPMACDIRVPEAISERPHEGRPWRRWRQHARRMQPRGPAPRQAAAQAVSQSPTGSPRSLSEMTLMMQAKREAMPVSLFLPAPTPQPSSALL